MQAQYAELRKVIEPGVAALGFELVDVELVGQGRRSTLRVYIDGPRGITVDDCAAVSRQISAVLDVEDPIPGSYALEVSSPGLDRPLARPADFHRYRGEEVKVRTVEAIDGRRNFKGRLVEAGDSGIVLDVDDKRFELAYDSIERARLVPRF